MRNKVESNFRQEPSIDIDRRSRRSNESKNLQRLVYNNGTKEMCKNDYM